MDTITDILSTFFVNSKVKNKDTRPIKQREEVKQITSESLSSSSESSSSTSLSSQRSLSPSRSVTVTSHKSTETLDSSTHENLDESEQSETQPEEAFNLQRHIMKVNEYSKRNIFIQHADFKENLSTLSDLIYNTSLMKNLEEIFDPDVTIISNDENKRSYRKMILENPYLYFRIKVSPKGYQGNNSSTKRKIIIIDDSEVDKYKEIIGKDDIQLYVISTNYNKTNAKVYRQLCETTRCLLIHKKEKLKTLEQKFFTNTIKTLTDINISFDEYHGAINNPNLEIRNVVLCNLDLKYN
jgi:hypothetical protein